MTIATAMQAFVDTWQAHAGIDLDPTQSAAMEAASAAFAAALPALTSSGDSLDTLATRNATAATVPMNNHKFSGLAAGTTAGDSVEFAQWQATRKGGANGLVGTATLVGGTVTVATTAVKTGAIIMLTRKTPHGTAGDLSLGAIVDSTSFVINSANGADTSDVNWFVINPT